jgi:hypothetical protein
MYSSNFDVQAKCRARAPQSLLKLPLTIVLRNIETSVVNLFRDTSTLTRVQYITDSTAPGAAGFKLRSTAVGGLARMEYFNSSGRLISNSK